MCDNQICHKLKTCEYKKKKTKPNTKNPQQTNQKNKPKTIKLFDGRSQACAYKEE